MPRDSAWRTSPTRRSQVSAGARPRRLQPSAAVRPLGRPAPSFFPLLLSWCSLSVRALPDAGGCSRGEGVRLSCLIVCTRGSARPPSLGSGALAPPSLWARAGRAREPGTPGGGRGARAGRRAGRPPRGSRSGKLGRTAAAVCPAPQSEWRLPHSRPRAGGSGGETRRAPLAARSAPRILPGGRAHGAGAGGRRGGATPPGGTQPSDVCSSRLVWGVYGLPVSGLGRAFALRVLSAFPIAVGHSRFGGHPRHPARRPGLSAISPARLFSEAAPT